MADYYPGINSDALKRIRETGRDSTGRQVNGRTRVEAAALEQKEKAQAEQKAKDAELVKEAGYINASEGVKERLREQAAAKQALGSEYVTRQDNVYVAIRQSPDRSQEQAARSAGVINNNKPTSSNGQSVLPNPGTTNMVDSVQTVQEGAGQTESPQVTKLREAFAAYQKRQEADAQREERLKDFSSYVTGGFATKTNYEDRSPLGKTSTRFFEYTVGLPVLTGEALASTADSVSLASKSLRTPEIRKDITVKQTLKSGFGEVGKMFDPRTPEGFANDVLIVGTIGASRIKAPRVEAPVSVESVSGGVTKSFERPGGRSVDITETDFRVRQGKNVYEATAITKGKNFPDVDGSMLRQEVTGVSVERIKPVQRPLVSDPIIDFIYENKQPKVLERRGSIARSEINIVPRPEEGVSTGSGQFIQAVQGRKGIKIKQGDIALITKPVLTDDVLGIDVVSENGVQRTQAVNTQTIQRVNEEAKIKKFPTLSKLKYTFEEPESLPAPLDLLNKEYTKSILPEAKEYSASTATSTRIAEYTKTPRKTFKFEGVDVVFEKKPRQVSVIKNEKVTFDPDVIFDNKNKGLRIFETETGKEILTLSKESGLSSSGDVQATETKGSPISVVTTQSNLVQSAIKESNPAPKQTPGTLFIKPVNVRPVPVAQNVVPVAQNKVASGQRQTPKTQNKVATGTNQTPVSTLAFDTGLDQRQNQRTVQRSVSKQKQESGSHSSTKPDVTRESARDVLRVPAQRQEEKQEQEQNFKPLQGSPLSQTEPRNKPTTPVTPLFVTGLRDTVKNARGFFAEQRRGKEFKRLNKEALSYDEAVNYGAYATEQNLGASFRVVDAGREATGSFTKVANLGDFYKSKREAGVFVQKREKRLGTLNERSEIQGERRKKSRFFA